MNKRIPILVLACGLISCGGNRMMSDLPMEDWPRPKACESVQGSNHDCCLDHESNQQCIVRLEAVIRERSLALKGPTPQTLDIHKQYVHARRIEVESGTAPAASPSTSSVPLTVPTIADPVQPVPWSTSDGVSLEK